MNVDFITKFPGISADFLSEARTQKSKSLIIKHMQQYLEMDKKHLASKEKVLHALLTTIGSDNSDNSITFPVKKADLLISLDKLCLLSSLFFNLKVIAAHGLLSMQDEIAHEFSVLRAAIEFLLLGMEQHQEAYDALSLYVKTLDKIQAQPAADLKSLEVLEEGLKNLIEKNTLQLFQGIEDLNNQGNKVRYLLSDIMFESLVSA